MSENGADIIVKIVNSGEEYCHLTVKGNWNGITGGKYEYYAPGDLKTANSMENKNAVALKAQEVAVTEGAVKIGVDPLSAGVLVIHRK